ncbi:MAG: Bax inhibitor-1/YccA family protein, partial [Flavobacteriaceae bacterium]
LFTLKHRKMSKHLSLRSGNPVLSKSTFSSATNVTETMTIEGTVNKTAICLFILVGAGYLTFDVMNPVLLVGCGIGGFVTALITIFKKEWAAVTVPIYAVLEGGLLGGVSYMYNSMYEGIVSNAIFLTIGILLALLMAYRSGLIKPTENFKLGIVAATGGIAIVYLINFVMSFFGSGMGIMSIQNASLMSVGFSLVVVVIAALNLVLDFDFIEEGAEKGAPKYMEWYGAFGLLVTLIWLYLEILRLLAKLNSRK